MLAPKVKDTPARGRCKDSQEARGGQGTLSTNPSHPDQVQLEVHLWKRHRDQTDLWSAKWKTCNQSHCRGRKEWWLVWQSGSLVLINRWFDQYWRKHKKVRICKQPWPLYLSEDPEQRWWLNFDLQPEWFRHKIHNEDETSPRGLVSARE